MNNRTMMKEVTESGFGWINLGTKNVWFAHSNWKAENFDLIQSTLHQKLCPHTHTHKNMVTTFFAHLSLYWDWNLFDSSSSPCMNGLPMNFTFPVSHLASWWCDNGCKIGKESGETVENLKSLLCAKQWVV